MRYKWDVFLSYSTKNRTICETILADLEGAGFRCWYDYSLVGVGTRIREKIEEGIRRSACILVLLSEHSLRSRWVLNELDSAMLREIRERRTLVIPVLVGRLDNTRIPQDLQGKHHIDLRYNFAKQYKLKRDLLLRSIGLVAPQAVGSRRITMLGRDAMSFLFSKTYPRRQVGMISSDWWDALADAVVNRPNQKVDTDFAPSLGAFLTEYGREGLRRLFKFVFDIKAIDLRGGFTEREFEEALSEAEWFILVMDAHNLSISQGGGGIELLLSSDKREFVYRVVPPLTDKKKITAKKNKQN